MFRKIHSKADKPSLVIELRKEFGAYIERLELVSYKLLRKYPRQVFYAMVVLIFISGILAFSVMRQSPPGSSIYSSKIKSSASTSVGTLLQTGTALKEVLELQHQIQSILQKDSLSSADTLMLQRAFRRMDAINTQLTPKK